MGQNPESTMGLRQNSLQVIFPLGCPLTSMRTIRAMIMLPESLHEVEQCSPENSSAHVEYTEDVVICKTYRKATHSSVSGT